MLILRDGPLASVLSCALTLFAKKQMINMGKKNFFIVCGFKNTSHPVKEWDA
jgi:hypothetical protein